MKKKKLKASLIKKAAANRSKKSDSLAASPEDRPFVCYALREVGGREYEQTFSKLFSPDHVRLGSSWTFEDDNEHFVGRLSYQPQPTELQDCPIHDLALCLFYEMVRCGDV